MNSCQKNKNKSLEGLRTRQVVFRYGWKSSHKSAQLSDSINFSMELYYGDQLCSKCMTKSFISYPVNDIQAYKCNTIMTLQSAIASNVTVIAGILVCIVVRLPIGLPPAPWSCVMYFCICEYLEKLTKLVTWRRNSDRMNLSVDL